MSERPTPETDKAVIESQGQWSFVLKETCQRLERERDKARAALDEIEKYGTEEINAAIKLRQKLADARIERDEARDDAAHWKIEYEIVVSRLCGNKHPRDNGVIFEHEIIPKLTRERDEARERAAKLAAQLLTEMEGAK